MALTGGAWEGLAMSLLYGLLTLFVAWMVWGQIQEPAPGLVG
jgi:hypothetical protein